MTWACALAMSLLQDQGMGELLTQLDSEEPKKRQEAMEAIVGGWAKWKEEDLKKLAHAQEGSDVEVYTRVREAVTRVDICRKVGAKVLEKVPRLDEKLYQINTKECVGVLKKVWEACPGEDLGGVVEVAKGMPWSVEEKTGMLKAIDDEKMRSYTGLAAAWLKDSDATVRGSAVWVLGTLGAKEQVGAIAALLKDSDASVREKAVFALATLGAKEQAGSIAALLKDSNALVRRDAASALATLGAKEQVGAIAALLKDSDAGVRRDAASALADLDAKEQVGVITALLKDSDKYVRGAAVLALATLGAKEQAGSIATLLKDSDAWVRGSAAFALGTLGAKEQVGAIAALLKDSDAKVRGYAADALANLDAKEQVGAIAALLKDSDAKVRWYAVLALSTLGAKEQAGAIATLLKDSDKYVRGAATGALANLDAKEHLQAIGELLKDGDKSVQASAIRAIDRLGPPALESQADELGRKLDALQKDQNEVVRFRAAVARIGWKRATVQEESNQLQECKEAWQAVELIDALTRRYEKEGYKAMAAQREVKEDLKSWEDVKRWAKEGGMELEGSSTLRGTIWKGSERSMLQVISSELGGELWEIEGKKVRAVGWEEALKYWQQRFSDRR